MGKSKTIVVAGYGAWARAETNPAALTMKGVANLDWQEHNLVALEFPVLTEGLYHII